MEIAENSATRTFAVADMEFSCPEPFEEGHTCSDNESSALNQLLIENVRNNMRSKIEKAMKEGKPVEEIQAQITGYVEGYEFGKRSTGGSKKDPVDIKAFQIARDLIKKSLKAEGHNLRTVENDNINMLAEQLLEKHPQIRAKAEQIVAIQDEVVSSIEGVVEGAKAADEPVNVV